MAFFYLPIALVTIATLLYYYFTRTFNYWKDRGVVGPEPVAFFGNLKESTLRRKNIGIVFKEIYDAYPNEKIVGVYRMTTPCLLIRDLDIVKHIMIKDFDAFVDRGFEISKEGLGSNLFHADGDTWRVLRNRFTPIFTSGKLKKMLYLMEERGDKFVEYIDGITAQQSEHEIYKLVQNFTMATISACAFGLDVDVQKNKENIDQLANVSDLVLSASYARELAMMYPGLLKKLNRTFFPKAAADFFYDLANEIITQRNGVPTNRNDFMDLILELRQAGTVEGSKKTAEGKTLTLEITEHVIAAQAFIFYVAGFETSATTMAFMLYSMAKHPDIQEKLIADVDAVLEKHNGKVTYETIQDMTYMEKVFDETLRMHSLVEPLQRTAEVDYRIPGTHLTIKKGTTVLISPMGIQHDKKYYDNPEKFDPERHTPENSKNRHSCAYLPFGVGPRNCIGMRFAKVQSKMCMIKFFSKYRVEMSKSTQKVIEISPYRPLIGPKGGVCLNIIKRK